MCRVSIFDPNDDLRAIDQPPTRPEPKNPCVFPSVIVDRDRYSSGLTIEMGGGLHLRDYFAAQVIGGLMASDAASQQTRYTAARLAERAYMMADAMIVARRVRPMTEGDHAG